MIAHHPNYLWVQSGYGLGALEDWLYFGFSLMMWLQQLPLMGALLHSGSFGCDPANVRYGDSSQGLPIFDHSVGLL